MEDRGALLEDRERQLEDWEDRGGAVGGPRRSWRTGEYYWRTERGSWRTGGHSWRTVAQWEDQGALLED